MMHVQEPINFTEWNLQRDSHARLFTCGRPGRATFGRAKIVVAEQIIDEWVDRLPEAESLHIVSLLGQKTSGASEFQYYPFRSYTESGAKPTFAEWLNARYKRHFVVHEFPTVDARGIPSGVMANVTACVADLVKNDNIIVILDSAGAERIARVCEALGYRKKEKVRSTTMLAQPARGM